MPLIDASRVIQNLIALAVIFGIGLMIYAKMDKEEVKAIIEAIKGLFRRREE